MPHTVRNIQGSSRSMEVLEFAGSYANTTWCQVEVDEETALSHS